MVMIYYFMFFVSFGFLVFVFVGYVVFFVIYVSMEKSEEYEEMFDNFYVIVVLNCFVFGVVGYCLYGDNVVD